MDGSGNNLEVLIAKLEKEGEDKLNKLKETRKLTIESLTNLMQTGEQEFIQKMGRPMTYSEMRAIYG